MPSGQQAPVPAVRIWNSRAFTPIMRCIGRLQPAVPLDEGMAMRKHARTPDKDWLVPRLSGRRELRSGIWDRKNIGSARDGGRLGTT